MAETKYKQTEIGVIPEDWEVASLGKVCTVKGRIGFRGYTRKDLVDESNGAITLSPANIIDGILSFENCTYISWYKYFESPEIMAELGDIVFTKTASVGKTALIRTLPKETTINPQLVLLKNISCNSAFLSYILQDVRFQNDVKAETGQGCVPNVPQSVLEKIEVPLPPLTEQHAIASALTSIDNLIASLDKQIAKTQSVKQGAMQQLLMGKTRLKGFSESWKTYKIDDLFYIGNGYTPSKANPLYWTNGTIPWFRLEDIRKNGRILNDSIQHITPLAVKSGKLFPPDSYILSTTATIGEHAHITVASLSNQQFSILLKKPNRKDVIDTIYFFYYLYIIGDWCRNNINAGGLNAVNIEDLKNLEFLAPSSIEEQHAIASALTAIDDQISALEAKRGKYEMVKVGMMQQLLTGKIRLK